MVLGIIAFIAYPLVLTPRSEIADAPDPLDALASQRDSLYDAIRDLDFDFQLGKLSENDYTPLREKYKNRAAETLKQIDTLRGESERADAEAQIETQIAQMRRAKTDAIETAVAQLRRAKTDPVEAEIAQVRAARQSENKFCSNCGTPFHSGDLFCAKCGKKLN